MSSYIIGLEVKTVELELDARCKRARLLGILRQPTGKWNILHYHQSLSWWRHQMLVRDYYNQITYKSETEDG